MTEAANMKFVLVWGIYHLRLILSAFLWFDNPLSFPVFLLYLVVFAIPLAKHVSVCEAELWYSYSRWIERHSQPNATPHNHLDSFQWQVNPSPHIRSGWCISCMYSQYWWLAIQTYGVRMIIHPVSISRRSWGSKEFDSFRAKPLN